MTKTCTIYGPMNERAFARGREFQSAAVSSVTHVDEAIRQGIVRKPGAYIIEAFGELAIVNVRERLALEVVRAES